MVNNSNTIFNVLLVENDKIAQRFVSAFLAEANCHTDLATTGKEALQLTESNCYHLIFMDIGLDDTDGFETTRLIRNSASSSNRETSIIALTAHISDDYVKKSREVGMNEFVTKPISVQKIKEILKQYATV